jgi:3-oxoacyl-(acyl-carrier-protein) synthase
MSKVFVTGFGAISAIGNSALEARSSLINGTSGIKKARFFNSNYVNSLLFGEIPLNDEDLINLTNSPKNSGLTRTSLIALAAFQQAITSANLSEEVLSSFTTGFISASTVGGMCYTDKLYEDANLQGEASEFVGSYEASDHTFQIANRYTIKGYTDTINTACSSSANAILLGARLIQSGRLERVIVGGADSLAKYTVNGFNALMILSDEACAPFSTDRKGLNLGEAGAYLVLENEACANKKKKYAEVIGFGNSNDAFHPSATSPDAVGPVLAMQKALQVAGLTAGQINYINAHGTGTINNDETESTAFATVFENNPPPYNSTKSYTGHTLAASGALEAIFSVLSMENNELYPSLNCQDPINTFPFQPIQTYCEQQPIHYIMSNSFGFGGNCTSLIFSKCM